VRKEGRRKKEEKMFGNLPKYYLKLLCNQKQNNPLDIFSSGR
jgi:hypothetical protein